ncbi:MAG: peptide deformylase [Devosia sp.]
MVSWPDPRFGRKAAPRTVDDGLLAIGARLRAAAMAAKAYGLAAVHIGAVAPVAVISTVLDPTRRDYLELYNPEIVWLSPETAEGPEGSVSMPGFEIAVQRSSTVGISYDDEHGTRVEMQLDGLPARIAQHEIDQVNGIFFLDRVSRLKRDMALKRWKKRGAEQGGPNS